ncbi:MAG: glycosyltransferase, partial [Gammaproteobacteria bacterium]|nr:glycosyltransferase [Gemmatimonadota bacterium]NIU76173.1 glycosyltransferase [Gammaproteobacteria bacterium]NIX24889.1 glycosyltransferase [Actinomycetota bacterium]
MIYISIPAHNEERTAGVVLWKVRQVMSEFGRDYEVLFLDDASTDRTPDVEASSRNRT